MFSLIANQQAVPVVDLTGSDDDIRSSSAGNASGAAATNLYAQFKDLEQQEGVIRNIYDLIYCVVCQKFIDLFDGILIRNCLHQTCVECIRKVIIDCVRTSVKCPVADCEYELQDREIACLLTPPEYERHILKDVNRDCNNPGAASNDELYKELMDLEQQGLIQNTDKFECDICCMEIEPSDGIILRECLHPFCVDCIRHTILHSEEVVIGCPATNCHCFIQDREIRGLLAPDEFDKHIKKALRLAESTAPNSYHCKKTNCEGWCFVDDAVNQFVCPVCFSINCLACQAIHLGQNCKQYQDELLLAGMTDNQRSEFCLDELVRQNKGMRCTNCKIVIMKRDGCDFLKCSMCKTELCWARKMNRWGPRGRGDTSGGCGCMPNKRCHPKCGNCH